MPKQDRSPLVVAAEEFDQQLASYARLGELFLKTPLESVKHLERANATLQEIAGCEERLQAAGKALVVALSSAREQQEQLAQAVVAHVPALQARNERLHALMGELTALAGEVGGLNAEIQAKSGNGDSGAPPTAETAHDLSQAILGLSSARRRWRSPRATRASRRSRRRRTRCISAWARSPRSWQRPAADAQRASAAPRRSAKYSTLPRSRPMNS